MTISINGVVFDNVTELSAERRARCTDVRYNTQGDLLIDMVNRKYRLTVTFALMSERSLKQLRALTSDIFVNVSFQSPEGSTTAVFHVTDEPAPTVTVINGITMYGGVKYIFEER